MENPFEIIMKQINSLEEQISELKDYITNPKNIPEKELISREEAAELLHVNSTTIHRWTIKGKLKKYGLGGSVYYKRSEIMDAVKLLN